MKVTKKIQMCYCEAELIGCCVATLKLRMAFRKDLSLVPQSLSMQHHTTGLTICTARWKTRRHR